MHVHSIILKPFLLIQQCKIQRIKQSWTFFKITHNFIWILIYTNICYIFVHNLPYAYTYKENRKARRNIVIKNRNWTKRQSRSLQKSMFKPGIWLQQPKSCQSVCATWLWQDKVVTVPTVEGTRKDKEGWERDLGWTWALSNLSLI